MDKDLVLFNENMADQRINDQEINLTQNLLQTQQDTNLQESQIIAQDINIQNNQLLVDEKALNELQGIKGQRERGETSIINDLVQESTEKEKVNKVKKKCKYDPFKVPPDMEIVELHRKANKVGTPENFDKFCPCCQKPVNKNAVKLGIDREDLGFLGPLFPLYFKYVIYCTAVCVAMFVINFYPMIANYYGKACEDSIYYKCKGSELALLSMVNNLDLQTNSYFSLVTVVVLMVLNQIYFRSFRISENKIDNVLDTPSDYTLMVSDLPKGKYTKEQIKDLFDKFWEHHKGPAKQFGKEINNINLAYDTKSYQQLIEEKEKILAQLLDLKKKDKEKGKHSFDIKAKIGQESSEYSVLHQQIKEVEQKLKQIEHDVNNGNVENTAGVAFVTFEKQTTSEYILKFNQCGYMRYMYMYMMSKIVKEEKMQQLYPDMFYFKGKFLTLQEAPEPTDVLWKNMGVSIFTLIRLRYKTFFYTAIVLIISFYLIFVIYLLQGYLSYKKLDKEHKLTQKELIVNMIISFSASFFILFINNVLYICIRIFSAKELLPTITQMSTSIARKLSVSQFINTALIMILVEQFQRQRRLEQGLIDNAFTLFLSNALSTPLLNYFNIWYYWRIQKRKKLMKYENRELVTQKEAHQAFSGPVLQMEYKYVFILKNLCLTAFYAPLSVYLIPLTIMGFFISYWMDKYLILNRYNEPELLSPFINRVMSRYLDYVPLCYAFGNITFKAICHLEMEKAYPKDFDNISYTIDIIIIGIAALNYFIPSIELNKILFKIDGNDNTQSPLYSEARLYFNQEYDRVNPLTRKAACKKWSFYLKLKGMISEEQFKSQNQEQLDIIDDLTQETQQQNFSIFGQNIHMFKYQQNFFKAYGDKNYNLSKKDEQKKIIDTQNIEQISQNYGNLIQNIYKNQDVYNNNTKNQQQQIEITNQQPLNDNYNQTQDIQNNQQQQQNPQVYGNMDNQQQQIYYQNQMMQNQFNGQYQQQQYQQQYQQQQYQQQLQFNNQQQQQQYMQQQRFQQQQIYQQQQQQQFMNQNQYYQQYQNQRPPN